MVLFTKLSVICCFTYSSFRPSHEDQAGGHGSRCFSQRLFLTQGQQTGVSLCLLGTRAWQLLELPAELLRISSAMQPPAEFLPQRRHISTCTRSSAARSTACPVDPEACKPHLAVVGIFPPGYLVIFYLRHVHLYLMGCVFQRQGNHRVESWVLVLTKILLLWLRTPELNLLHLKWSYSDKPWPDSPLWILT